MTGPWCLDKLSAVAGEPGQRLEWYAEVGLLHRRADGDFEPDSLHRLRLIRFARSRGVDDEQLAAANARQGDLLGIFDELAEPAEGLTDLVAAGRDLGLDDAVLAELADILDWEAIGAGGESDVAALRVVAKALSLGMPRDAMMQVVRVLADAMDRLADAEIRTVHNYVHERFRARGLTGRELLEATRGVSKPVLELAEPAVIHFHRRAYARANNEDLLRHLAEDTTAPAATPGEEYATVLFVDLAGFTPLTATMGDQMAADLLGRFSATTRRSSARYRGRILKQIGDAFMLMFAQPTHAVEFGLAMECFVDAEPRFPALHIGAHHGTVLYRDGDYVGGTVNLAARVASAGAAGQFLITADLQHAVADLADTDFAALPPRRLKGIADPVCLFEVRRRNAHRNRETDPVCGLLLHPDAVAARSTWQGTTFAFCGQVCQHAFTHNPRRFVEQFR